MSTSSPVLTSHLSAALALRGPLVGDAARVEREGVTRADLQPLVDAGLYGVYAPVELGGARTAAEQREVAEVLAGAGPDVWFLWFQHAPAIKMLATTTNADLRALYLDGLVAGRLQSGVSYSHLRNPAPSIAAVRDGDDYLLSGRQPWCTGWGINDLILVGAVDAATGEVVFGLLPSGDGPGVRGTGELDLASMGGTVTHGLVYDAYRLPTSHVLNVLPLKDFLAVDALSNSNVQPSTFGVALAALDLLEERSAETAAVLRDRVMRVRTEAYRLLDEVPLHEKIEERLALRAQALLLGIESATALLTASGGRGMGLDDPAQRLLRAAAFHLIHSQAEGIRTATLAALRA